MTTNLTPLTAADLVVGQSYSVWTTLHDWAPAIYSNILNSKYVFTNKNEAWWIKEEDIPRRVKRLPEPQTFPDPPAGRKWHNPECLTPEQVGVAEGWRLCLEDEMDDFDHEGWLGNGCWVEAANAGVEFVEMEHYTYRTKHPLPPNTTVEAPTDREALLAYNWSVLQKENARLKTRIGELEEEVQRKSWRPVSEKPEEGDLDGDRCVMSVRQRPDGSTYTTYLSADYWPWEGAEPKVLFWKPADVPGLTEDQKFAQWKAAASEEERDAAMLAGWKAKGGVA